MDDRAEFEAWAEQAGWPHRSINADGSYFFSSASWEPWQAATQRQQERIAELERDLKFVERWANHHGAKPHTTAESALSVIQHYPPITAITRGYADGVVPDTFDPYARIAELQAQVQALTLETERTARNRDMWKGQTRRQADRLHDLHTCMAAIKRLLARDPCAHANTAIQMIDAAIAAGKGEG